MFYACELDIAAARTITAMREDGNACQELLGSADMHTWLQDSATNSRNPPGRGGFPFSPIRDMSGSDYANRSHGYAAGHSNDTPKTKTATIKLEERRVGNRMAAPRVSSDPARDTAAGQLEEGS